MDYASDIYVKVANETRSSFARYTRDGRKITYRLCVLQHPDKARACGFGSKSSADRRPVDPPPIVELRMFEGENETTDITFKMNANYFLFASLEHSRPMAQGRMAQENRHKAIITGTPVAGIVYLDRPSPAGYFIFPDLSIRHEGMYRLCFSLFEELKHECDHDVRADTRGPQSVTHRLEVKTVPFPVYIAKKFPGLSSSTILSRTFAEQGCRVRIRRDVRLRKPDKLLDGYDYQGDSERYTQRYAAITAQPTSPSATHSMFMRAPDATDTHEDTTTAATALAMDRPVVSRKASIEQLSSIYPSGSYFSMTQDYAPLHGFSKQHNYSAYNNNGAASMHDNTQLPPLFPSQSACLPSQPTSYGRQSDLEPAMLPSQDRSSYYHVSDQTTRPAYQADHSLMPASSFRALEYRANDDTQHNNHLFPASTTGEQGAGRKLDYDVYSNGRGLSSSETPVSRTMARDLPRIDTSAMSATQALLPEPSSVSRKSLPSTSFLHSASSSLNTSGNFLPPPSQLSAPSSTYGQDTQSSSSLSNTGKRRFDTIFDTQHLHGSLHSGARPDAFDARELPEMDSAGRSQMRYRRANGRETVRILPAAGEY